MLIHLNPARGYLCCTGATAPTQLVVAEELEVVATDDGGADAPSAAQAVVRLHEKTEATAKLATALTKGEHQLKDPPRLTLCNPVANAASSHSTSQHNQLPPGGNQARKQDKLTVRKWKE